MRITVRTSQQGRGRHRAWCPELPGCRVSGCSRKEAIERIDGAVRGYLASLNRPAVGEVRKVVVPE